MNRRLVVVAVGAALLASCGGDEHRDLKQELHQLTRDFRGRVEPLPQVKAYEPVPYTAEGQVDPFRPERIDVADAAARTASSGSTRFDKERDRPKEPLEAFPLESINMLGTITKGRETHALVKAGPNLFRVRKGNYMGQNFGIVTGIDEGQISLKELIQESGGEWVERESALQLVETKR